MSPYNPGALRGHQTITYSINQFQFKLSPATLVSRLVRQQICSIFLSTFAFSPRHIVQLDQQGYRSWLQRCAREVAATVMELEFPVFTPDLILAV